MAKETGGRNFLLGAVVGGLIGAAAALLLTPKTGREMREELVKRWDLAKVKGREWMEAIREQADITPEQWEQAKEVARSKWIELRTTADNMRKDRILVDIRKTEEASSDTQKDD
ncbi:YtxH domain-containing protein [Polycladomyces subterraneus]|uniref:YtxH domain-containing protein n=1 Tax=Polycladomyces subterraneus TaxID=1016997 RepID=A0ABT8ISI6_9BACL|nr:YtxH domain-containing protein [Polycladomyces subterraneus]MDN4595352.1 YtxH domain-containing protein [Polycladomyces subterraneus]